MRSSFFFLVLQLLTAIAQDCSEEQGKWEGNSLTTRRANNSADCCDLCSSNSDCEQWQFGNSRCLLFDGNATPARSRSNVRGEISSDGGDGGDGDEISISWTIRDYDPIDAEVGDTLVFDYTPQHNVWLFSDEDSFDDCSFSGSDAEELSGRQGSPFRFEIGSAETHYFGCEIPGHCQGGQKVEVRVGGGDGGDGDDGGDGEPTMHRITWEIRDYDAMTVNANDGIRFTFSSSHNLYLMDDRSAWDDCDFDDADELADTDESPYTFMTRGSHVGRTLYFACEVGNHCDRGQKIAITVQ